MDIRGVRQTTICWTMPPAGFMAGRGAGAGMNFRGTNLEKEMFYDANEKYCLRKPAASLVFVETHAKRR